MGLLEKMEAARPARRGKSFSQPPFWQTDRLHSRLLQFAPEMGLQPDRERIGNDFEGYVHGAYKANGIVFALILARKMVFSEARFLWRRLRDGRPGELFGNQELALLENPWPGGTTGELLARMELDASLAGNFFATTADDAGRLGRAATGPGRRIVRARPDWVTIVIGSQSGDPNALDARIVGFLYEPRSAMSHRSTASDEAVLLMPDEVVHYSPEPDPEARFRGMSWLTPVLREIQADTASTLHKERFLNNAATPNLVIKFDRDTGEDAFNEFVEKFNAGHKGAWNAYNTLFLAGGADATPVSADFKQLEFSATQGKGESRLASAAGVPPSWVGFSEGLQGSALNAGNFNAARRRYADGTMRPLWRMAAASLQTLVTPPGEGVHLWYDDRDIPFLQEDRSDAAEIQQNKAVTIRQLVESGYEPNTVVAAVQAEDYSLLRHTGVFSVQLQPPATGRADGEGNEGGEPAEES